MASKSKKGASASATAQSAPDPARKMPEPANTDDMPGIVAATLNSPEKHGWATEARAIELEGLGLVQKNLAIRDENGNVAVRATDAGLTFGATNEGTQTMTNTQAASAASTGTAASTAPRTFEIDSGVAMPAGRGVGAGKGSSYPFAQLEVGQSFHIPVTPDVPEPWKKYMSVASTGAKRFAKKLVNPDGSPKMVTRTIKDRKTKQDKTVTTQEREATRKFAIRKVGADDPRGVGARIFRTQ